MAQMGPCGALSQFNLVIWCTTIQKYIWSKWMTLKPTKSHQRWHYLMAVCHFLLVVFSNGVFMLHHFEDITRVTWPRTWSVWGNLLLFVVSLHAWFEVSSFTSSIDRMEAPNFNSGSCDPDHALFGMFVIHRLVLAMINYILSFKKMVSTVSKIGRRTQNLQIAVVWGTLSYSMAEHIFFYLARYLCPCFIVSLLYRVIGQKSQIYSTHVYLHPG